MMKPTLRGEGLARSALVRGAEANETGKTRRGQEHSLGERVDLGVSKLEAADNVVAPRRQGAKGGDEDDAGDEAERRQDLGHAEYTQADLDLARQDRSALQGEEEE